MVAYGRYSKRLIMRGAMFALIAAAFVAMSGVPAQAAVYYYYTYPPYPYYQSNCSTVMVGAIAYTSCRNPAVYSPSPVYYGYPYDNYYYPSDRYYTRDYYYHYYGR